MTYNVGDRPEFLTDSVVATVLEYVRQDLLLNNAARCARVHTDTLKNYLKIGENEAKSGLKTFLANFFLQVKESQGKKISELLLKIESCTKNWQALAWKLEKCFSEDFGIDNADYKQLLDLYTELRDHVKALQDKTLARQGQEVTNINTERFNHVEKRQLEENHPA